MCGTFLALSVSNLAATGTAALATARIADLAASNFATPATAISHRC
jgi:hypothetical protein